VSYQVTGLNHIPQKGGVILACKHQSAWETFALIAILPTPISFVYKKELIYLPLFGQVLWTLRMIPIDRSQGSKAFKSVCEKGQSYLDQGQVVLMFPEGTRTAVGSPPNYKNGVGRLSIAVQRPIIPIALNSGLYWPKKGFSKNSGIIRVVVGSPITPPLSNTPDDMYRLMSQVKENIENAFSSTPVTKNES
jgi:1-acyl-sn-glycerol-3-phosphate acyltransferase